MTTATFTIGWKAHAALTRASGRFAAIPGFADSAFRLAAGEPIWIGNARRALHPRAVIADAVARGPGSLPVTAVAPWRGRAPQLDPGSVATMRRSAVALAARLRDLGEPRGFAAVLLGDTPPFPLHGVAPAVAAVAAAIDRNDARALHDAALPLLGLGPGLTPSGDDFVGGALYARGCAPLDDAWTAARRDLIEAARRRTHAIGAALFGDLARRESFTALDRLTGALAAGSVVEASERLGHLAGGGAPAPSGRVRATARDVVAIGNSSGWDMLAGLIIGCAGTAALHVAVDGPCGKRCV